MRGEMALREALTRLELSADDLFAQGPVRLIRQRGTDR
jgi:hypothetical protein